MDTIEGTMLIPVRITNPATGKFADTVFRVDTGSDCSSLCLLVAQSIDVRPIGFCSIQGVERDPFTAPVFLLDIGLPDCPFGQIEMVGLDFAEAGYAGLIGNDILDKGLLVRDGEAGNWYFAVDRGVCGGTCARGNGYLPGSFLGLVCGIVGTLLLTRK